MVHLRICVCIRGKQLLINYAIDDAVFVLERIDKKPSFGL
jgi:hypothetical protein